MQRFGHRRRSRGNGQNIESFEQRDETTQHDDPDLQRPERIPADQLGNVN
jgi:hypothetical protein